MKGVEAGPMGATFEHQEVLSRPSLCRETAEIWMLRSRGEAARMMELQRHNATITLLLMSVCKFLWHELSYVNSTLH